MNIEHLLQWSAQKRIETKYGPKLLRTAPPNETFWKRWRESKDELKEQGISVSKDKNDVWQVCEWKPIPKEELDKNIQSLKESKAEEADIEIPCPEELDYFPFQKAGIKYATEHDNVLIADEMGCVDGEAIIQVNRAGKGKRYTIREAYLRFNQLDKKNSNWDTSIPTLVKSLCDGQFRLHRVNKILYKGIKDTIKVTTKSGKTLCLTPDHKIATSNGEWREAGELKVGDVILTNGVSYCPICGTSENIITYKYSKFPGYCKTCVYKKFRINGNFKSGKYLDSDGYIRVSGQQDHPHCTQQGYVLEHILVMEKKLGRYLEPGEYIHHINEDKADNRLENLQLVSCSEHHKLHNKYSHFEGKVNKHGQEIVIFPREDKIISIVSSGRRDVYDLVMENPYRNFVANGIVVHNCGKTLEAIGVINYIDSVKRVLVICPNTLKLNWKKEAEKWLTRSFNIGVVNRTKYPEDCDFVIINYDIVKKHQTKLREKIWDIVILDECFPYDTIVITEKGPQKIGDICENLVANYVLSCNLNTNMLEWKRIEARSIKNNTSLDYVKINYTNGNIVCTENHRIWTNNGGYKQAKEIKSGEGLYILPKDLPNYLQVEKYSSFLFTFLCITKSLLWKNSKRKTTDAHKSTKTGNSLLHPLWERVSVYLLQQKEALFYKVRRKISVSRSKFCSSACSIFSRIPRQIWQSNEREEESNCVYSNDEVKQRSQLQKEIRDGIPEKKRKTFSSPTWWKWFCISYSKTIFRLTKGAWNTCRNGVYSKYSTNKSSNREITKSLQDRYSPAKVFFSNRSRWTVPQQQTGKSSRWKKEPSSNSIRVESVESIKLQSYQQSTRDFTGSKIYNLQIEDNHNYFANGILVSNCHALKNPQSLRCKYILGKTFKKKENNIPPLPTKKFLGLTGTPILNKPIELWTIVKAFDPGGLGQSWWKFVTKYCGAYRGKYGFDTSGATNLEDLQKRLRESFMIRRLKKDVLKELPPKTRQLIELSSEDFVDLIKKENEAYNKQQEKIGELKAKLELAKSSDDKEEYKKAVERLRDSISAAFNEISKVRHETALAKVPQCIEFIENALEGGPVVVFAHHLDVIQQLHEAFPDSRVLIGSTDIETRQQDIEDFQAGKFDAYIVGIKAGGVGITLTRACQGIFVELDWTPSIVDQCEGRLDRIGQENPVLIQHLVLEDSLDARIAKTILRKQAIIDKALNVDDITSLVKEEPVLPFSGKEQVEVPVKLEELTDGQIRAIHEALKSLNMVCDGARAQDMHGFSKWDAYIGKSLANSPHLTLKQANLGKKLVNKYRRQIDTALLDLIGISLEKKHAKC